MNILYIIYNFGNNLSEKIGLILNTLKPYVLADMNPKY